MLKITKEGKSLIVQGVDNQHYPYNDTLTYPLNSVAMVIDDSDIVTFKSAANGDVLFSSMIGDITVNGEAVDRITIKDKFDAVSNAAQGGGGGGAVDSVNGKQGDVVITANDVDAYTKEEVNGLIPTIPTYVMDNLSTDYPTNVRYDSANNKYFLSDPATDINATHTFGFDKYFNIPVRVEDAVDFDLMNPDDGDIYWDGTLRSRNQVTSTMMCGISPIYTGDLSSYKDGDVLFNILGQDMNHKHYTDTIVVKNDGLYFTSRNLCKNANGVRFIFATQFGCSGIGDSSQILESELKIVNFTKPISEIKELYFTIWWNNIPAENMNDKIYMINVSSSGKLFTKEGVESIPTKNRPDLKSNYIRFDDRQKSYILTDQNFKLKTINDENITGDGNIEITSYYDLTPLYQRIKSTGKGALSDTEFKEIQAAITAHKILVCEVDGNNKMDRSNYLYFTSASDGNSAAPSYKLLASDVQNDYVFWVDEYNGDQSARLIVTPKLDISTKQDKLVGTAVEGQNIKTINGQSLLGSGDIEIQGGGATDGVKRVNLSQSEYDQLAEKDPNTLYYINDAQPLDVYSKTEINEKNFATQSWVTEQINAAIANVNTTIADITNKIGG